MLFLREYAIQVGFTGLTYERVNGVVPPDFFSIEALQITVNLASQKP